MPQSGSFQCQPHGVELQMRLARLIDFGGAEPLSPALRESDRTQQGLGTQIRGFTQTESAFCVLGTTDREDFIVRQLMALGLFERTRAESNVDIDTTVQRLPRPHTCDDSNTDVRMFQAKRRELAQNPASREPQRHSNNDLVRSTLTKQLGQRRIQPPEGFATAGKKRFTCACQPQPTRVTDEQRNPQSLLEKPHLLTHSRGRDTQLLRCRRQARMPCSGFKGSQPVHRRPGRGN